jgi:hypothetical protein
MDRSRNVIIELDGRVIGLRFDQWVLKQTQNKTQCKGVLEMFHRIGVDDGNIDLNALTILLVEAYNEYIYWAKKNNEPEHQTTALDERDASELIDDMGGMLDALAKISEGLSTYIPKNSQPLQTAGEKTSQ